MRWHGIAAAGTIALAAMTGFAGEADTESQRIWNAHVRGRPDPRILDGFGVIEMTLFRAVPGISPRSAALASIIERTGGHDVLKGGVTLHAILDLARSLKGGELTEDDRAGLARLEADVADKYEQKHPREGGGARAPLGTFALRDVLDLHRTVEDARTLDDALRLVSRLHGWAATAAHDANASFDIVRRSINRSIPVLLEGTGDTWRVCFGYLKADGRDYLLLADPSETPMDRKPMTVLPEEAASSLPQVQRTVARYLKRQILSDYRTDPSKFFPVVGLSIEPFERGRHAAHCAFIPSKAELRLRR
jgi:hypothetical protein